jgi:hypothetical protein
MQKKCAYAEQASVAHTVRNSEGILYIMKGYNNEMQGTKISGQHGHLSRKRAVVYRRRSTKLHDKKHGQMSNVWNMRKMPREWTNWNALPGV